MGGIISAITGKSSAEKRAKRERQAAADRERRVVDSAKAKSARTLAKQRSEEAMITKARGKRRVAAAGKKRRVFTSPLGLTDTGTQTLG